MPKGMSRAARSVATGAMRAMRATGASVRGPLLHTRLHGFSSAFPLVFDPTEGDSLMKRLLSSCACLRRAVMSFGMAASRSLPTGKRQSLAILVLPRCLAAMLAAGLTSFAGHAKAEPLFVSSYSGSISTIATNGTSTTFSTGYFRPYGMAFDSSGNLFVAVLGDNRIAKVLPDGTSSTFASGLNTPVSIAINSSGNLFVSLFGDNSIAQITSSGVVSTFASGGLINQPFGLAFNSSGNLFVSNDGNNTIAEITPAGVASSFATGGGLSSPTGMVFNAAGDLFVANQYAQSISKITPDGTVSTFVTSSSFSNAAQLAIDPLNNIYLASVDNNTIFKTTPEGVVSTYASSELPIGLAFQIVPEPSTYALAGLACGGYSLFRRRRVR